MTEWRGIRQLKGKNCLDASVIGSFSTEDVKVWVYAAADARLLLFIC